MKISKLSPVFLRLVPCLATVVIAVVVGFLAVAGSQEAVTGD